MSSLCRAGHSWQSLKRFLPCVAFYAVLNLTARNVVRCFFVATEPLGFTVVNTTLLSPDSATRALRWATCGWAIQHKHGSGRSSPQGGLPWGSLLAVRANGYFSALLSLLLISTSSTRNSLFQFFCSLGVLTALAVCLLKIPEDHMEIIAFRTCLNQKTPLWKNDFAFKKTPALGLLHIAILCIYLPYTYRSYTLK